MSEKTSQHEGGSRFGSRTSQSEIQDQGMIIYLGRSQRSSVSRAGENIMNNDLDQMMRTTMPRILAADDRTKFIQHIRSHDYENPEMQQMSATVRSKLRDMLKIQEDEEFLKKAKLYKLPPDNYRGPLIVNHALKPFENNFVVTNDAHSRHTNNGYQRNALGGFYAH
ncbi:UNKNOWN [Stylonychia lemnae]|uniref:Uncharacterized protein n=1 Tax=Stylonychia lemnae TaxID=5949 RepID=A0A078A0Z4_STYLE|nr:UNKNOWN [Stylonychia lemnae]|eukprot:CDW75871.1 UNKNOWN [Stylonychia lemnae]